MDWKHKLSLFDGGNVECPVDGCGCPWVKFLGTEVGTYQDGSEHTTLSFVCEWDHEWELSLSNHDGATHHRIESRTIEDKPEYEHTPVESPADRIWREK